MRNPLIARCEHFARLVRRTETPEIIPFGQGVVAVTLAVAVAATTVEWFQVGHGQWVIWSAASVVTGDAVSAWLKLYQRFIGAVVGVPAGVAIGAVIPHDRCSFELAALIAALTLVGFRNYVVGFGARCMCAALSFVLANQSAAVAACRFGDVVLGGSIGIAFVLAVHVITKSGYLTALSKLTSVLWTQVESLR